MKKESTQNSHKSLHFGRNEKASLKLLKQDSGRTWARLGWKNSLAKKSPPFENFSGRAHAHCQSPWPGRPRPQAIPRQPQAWQWAP